MTVAYSLTSELRKRLKEPLGALIRGSFAETMNTFKSMVEKDKPPRIISVGDTVSRNLETSGISPQLSIIDNIVMRRQAQTFQLTAETTIFVRNPQASITSEAITAIQDASRNNHRIKIVVDGEEDLLTLIAVLYAPDGSYVVYGQPFDGLVVVKVTPKKKTEVSEILKDMVSSKS